jgi:hypothetical protein
MEETYVVILIIAILILILYFINFSAPNKNSESQETNVQKTQVPQFKSYNPTENFKSCKVNVTQPSTQPSTRPSTQPSTQSSTQTTTQTTQPSASLKIHIAYWCGWSKKLLQQLESIEFKNKFTEVQNICVLEIINCEKNKEKCDPSIVKGFPTIILQTKSGKMIQYNGNRSNDDIINFIKANYN